MTKQTSKRAMAASGTLDANVVSLALLLAFATLGSILLLISP